jgi:flagellar basal body-associated protein FliL
MQQALIPIAAAAGLVALAGGAAALFWRSPDSTPEPAASEKVKKPEAVEEVEESEDEYVTPKQELDENSEDEYGTPELEKEDEEEDKELEAVEKEPPRGSVAVETCTVEQQLQAIKDDIVSKVREGVYDRKRALHEWTQPNTIRCRVPPNYKKELWHEIDKEFK